MEHKDITDNSLVLYGVNDDNFEKCHFFIGLALSRGRSMKQRIAAYSTAMESIQAHSEPVELDNEDVP